MVSKTLKEYTKEVHTAAEKTELSKAMLSGEITDKQWAYVLYQKMDIAIAIEKKIFLPENISMVRSISKDASHYFDTYDYKIFPSTKIYAERIEQSSLFVVDADLYVNYLGDLYGGRYIFRALKQEHKSHLDLDNSEERIDFIRNKIKGRDEELKDQSLKAFQSVKQIYEEIFEQTRTDL